MRQQEVLFTELLGWEWHDLMSSPQGVFSQAQLGDKVVGGVYTYQRRKAFARKDR